MTYAEESMIDESLMGQPDEDVSFMSVHVRDMSNVVMFEPAPVSAHVVSQNQAVHMCTVTERAYQQGGFPPCITRVHRN